MNHHRNFEELFKEKYEGPITKTHVEKGMKMKSKVLGEEKKEEAKFNKNKH